MNFMGHDPQTTSTLVEHLAQMPYFSAMEPAQLHKVAQHALRREFSTGEILFLQDDASSGLWVIETGRVKVARITEAGREHIARIAGPGDSINDIPALDEKPNAATVTAISDVVAWMLPSAVLIAEIRANPDLALATIHVLTDRVRLLMQQIEDLALCSVTTRLARFLLKQQDNTALDGPGITRGTIAAHLATTPETISRALRTLEDIGAIRFDRHDIMVLRNDLLHSVALDEE